MKRCKTENCYNYVYSKRKDECTSCRAANKGFNARTKKKKVLSQGNKENALQRNVQAAKRKKKDISIECCECCGVTGAVLDMAHIIGVADCKKLGIIEEAYNVDNILIACRSCHNLIELRRFDEMRNKNYIINYITKTSKEYLRKI